MNIFKIFKRSSNLENPANKITSDNMSDFFVPKNGVVTTENALQIASVYACVNVLSSNLAQLPLQVLKSENGKSEKATTHTLYELLHDTPNDFQTSYKMREFIMTSVLLYGNGYIEIVRNSKGQVTALNSLEPQSVELRKSTKTNRYVYAVTDEGKQRVLATDDVIHIKALGGIKKGVSIIQRHAQTLGLGKSARDFSYELFSSNARPTAIVSVKQDLQASSWERLVRIWSEKQRALAESDNKTMLIPAELDYTPLAVTPVDAELLAMMKLNRSEIAGIFNIPAHMINDLEKATFSNITEQTIQFIRFSLMPWVVNWEQELNRKLFTKREKNLGYYVKFNVAGLMRGTPKERADFYHFGITDGWLSRNEARKLEDLNEEKGLDEFLVSVNASQEINKKEVESGEKSEEQDDE